MSVPGGGSFVKLMVSLPSTIVIRPRSEEPLCGRPAFRDTEQGTRVGLADASGERLCAMSHRRDDFVPTAAASPCQINGVCIGPVKILGSSPVVTTSPYA